MIYLKKFDSHASYETEVNGGGVEISLPNVSYCKDVKDVHYTPYNLVRFYVGEITGATPQTVKIYTDGNNHVDVQVSKGNKWYSYLLPKDKSLFKIESGTYDSDNEEWVNGIVTKAVVKANVTTNSNRIIPYSTVEASFKGSNTSNVTDMGSMFSDCSGLTSLDLSDFDTSNVTDMSFMFYGCSCLTSLDVSNFNTSKVTNMGYMFSGCIGLTSLDLSGWDTSKVTFMGSMFSDCSGLKSLDLSNFNTSIVTNTNRMFGYCTGLTSLDLSNFNTSKVTDMGYMFCYCTSLTSLDLSNFNTSNVTDMDYMFGGCSGLASLDLSGWDMSSVTNTTRMFDACDALTSIRMKDCSEGTINKIKAVMPSSASISTV